MPAPNEGKLCFVVSGNHGSLVDTMLFLQGTSLLERSVLLLPPQLYGTHQTGLAGTVREYKSFEDLQHWMDVERPALVFLFSGYLLTSTGAVSAAQLKQLVRLLEGRGCVVVTNDPCWGLLASDLPMNLGLRAR